MYFRRPEPIGELSPDGMEVVIPGEARGVLLGGTLTQILASLSTPFAFAPPDSYVLLLDDVGERPYRIDRMLTQMAHSGLLRRAAAIVCAEFPRCSDDDGGDARSVFVETLRTSTAQSSSDSRPGTLTVPCARYRLEST